MYSIGTYYLSKNKNVKLQRASTKYNIFEGRDKKLFKDLAV